MVELTRRENYPGGGGVLRYITEWGEIVRPKKSPTAQNVTQKSTIKIIIIIIIIIITIIIIQENSRKFLHPPFFSKWNRYNCLTLGFAFCQPPKKFLPKSLTQKKSLQNFKPQISPHIANFKPKKGLRTSPSLIYLSTPPPPPLGKTTTRIVNKPDYHSMLFFSSFSLNASLPRDLQRTAQK